MTQLATGLVTDIVSIQEHLERAATESLDLFPAVEQTSAAEQRGIMARYTAVLEGNFIYWMTGALLAVRSEQARAIILENLHEEVRDLHPHMLRKFAMSAHAVPTDFDATAVYSDLLRVRRFIGDLKPVPIVVMMAFFEGFIQRFMPYLAELARRRGSLEQEYTDVHGTCDIGHTQELYRALEAEILATDGIAPEAPLFEGVELLRALIRKVAVC